MSSTFVDCFDDANYFVSVSAELGWRRAQAGAAIRLKRGLGAGWAKVSCPFVVCGSCCSNDGRF